MKIFKKLFIGFIIIVMFLIVGCENGNAISVLFSDITSAGNTNITFSVKYIQEKEYEEKGTDILIKSNKENISFKIKKELEDFIEISLPEKDKFYSLTKLMQGQNFEYNLYKDAVSKNYIINSNEDFVLTLKAVVGDVSEYKTMLLNSFDVSKEYNMEVKKYEKQ